MTDTKERAPMLSDDAMVALCESGQLYPWQTEARMVRNHYEHLITTGTLRVVEELAANLEPVQNEVTGAHWHEMSCCGWATTDMVDPRGIYVGTPFNYCPGCGAKMKP